MQGCARKLVVNGVNGVKLVVSTQELDRMSARDLSKIVRDGRMGLWTVVAALDATNPRGKQEVHLQEEIRDPSRSQAQRSTKDCLENNGI